MVNQLDSQQLESYVPVYDAIPEKWEDARAFLVEQLKRISNGINIREIGWYLDEELLSGKAFIPSSLNDQAGQTAQNFRTVLRMVVDVSPLVAGANIYPHGITFDDNFTLIDLWVAGTDSIGLTARVINGNDVLMNSINLVITSPQAFDRAFCVIEFLQEL